MLEPIKIWWHRPLKRFYSNRLFLPLAAGKLILRVGSVAVVNVLLFGSICSAQTPLDSSYHSFRYDRGRIARKDDNIFYYLNLAYIQRGIGKPVYTSSYVAPYLHPERPTCNFYRKIPGGQFPGHPLFSTNDKYRVADDADDTSLWLLAAKPSKETIKTAVEILRSKANFPANGHPNRYPRRWKKYPAYTTWISDNMGDDLDICVIANVLTAVSEAGIAWGNVDSASLALLRDGLRSEIIWKNPLLASPHYQRTPTILYHYARLYAADTSLLEGKDLHMLKELAHRSLETHKHRKGCANYFDSVMVCISLMKLGADAEKLYQRLLASGTNKDSDAAEFHYFYANTASSLPRPWNRWLARSRFFSWPYANRAHAHVLEQELQWWGRNSQVRQTQ